MSMFPDPKKMCHRTGFSVSCSELVSSGRCQDRWANITGTNVNTGEPLNKFGCVDDHQYMLQLSMESRLIGIQKAVETRGDNTAKMIAQSIATQERQHKEALQIGEALAEAPARQLHYFESSDYAAQGRYVDGNNVRFSTEPKQLELLEQ